MQTAPGDLLVGRLLEGRYRILERIAQGGMSTVYSAVDERLDRLVAVKVMSSALSSDPKFGDRFAREARAAAKLTHVNAVAVYDQGHDVSDGGHHVFLVMELVDGRTLRDLMRERSGRFTPAEAISIIEPVLAALAAAHRAGLVHRDVKPENILLSDAGVVKVADFGLARAIDADAAATRTGLMMGTVAYCSPEQISRGYADARSDVYSAGVVLFELLTGRPPYQGDSAMNVAWQHVHSRVPAPSSRTKGVPNEIDELVVAATDSDATGRPADGAVFLAEIADLRTELGLPVTPVPPRPRTANSDPRENRARAATEVIGGNGRVAHDTEIVGERPGTAPRRDDAPPPPVVIPPPKRRKERTVRQRRRRRAWIALALVIVIGAASVLGGVALTRWYQRWNSHVPKLSGLSVTDARAKIASEHYRLGPVRQVFSDTVQANQVISSDPGEGTRLEEGKSIILTVSLGEQTVEVPYVRRQTLADAEQILEQHGVRYTATPNYAPSRTVDKGDVIAIEPAAGTRITKSKSVQLTVSQGPPMVLVPTIAQNTPIDDAQKKLEDAKFQVDIEQDYNDVVPNGEVIDVSPAGGYAEYGSVVKVKVSKGPEFVQMPAIAFITPYTDAKAQLEALGLVVTAKVLGNKNRTGPAVVIDQSVPAETSVHVGSGVILTVIRTK